MRLADVIRCSLLLAVFQFVGNVLTSPLSPTPTTAKTTRNRNDPLTELDLVLEQDACATCCEDTLLCSNRSCTDRFNSDVNTSTCYCDASCEFFQDCCYDYPSVCNKTNITFVKEDISSWKCVSISEELSYWMKIKCSNLWRSDETESRCVNAPLELNSSTYEDFIPVLGADNITYRNRHCAKCNYQNRFEFWLISMSLNFQPAGVQTIEGLIDLMVEFYGDDIYKSVVPREKMPRRYCPGMLVSTCPTSFTRDEVRDECAKGGVALVWKDVPPQKRLFKNKYCAICNGMNILQCASGGYTKNYQHTDAGLTVQDFFLTINFKHKSQSSGFSFNPSCRGSKIYDHHLKTCLDPQDIVAPIDTPLDKYTVAVWFKWPYGDDDDQPNTNHFLNCLTDVDASNISNSKGVVNIQNTIYMIRFDVQLSLNQSFQLLKNYPKSESDSATAYSIVKFIKPFTRSFSIRLDSKIIQVVKTSSRRLGCVGLQVFNASEFSKIGRHGKIYVPKTKRYYTKDQYFKDEASTDSIKVCDKQLPLDCSIHLQYERSEFEVRSNLSLFHKANEVLYKFGDYTLENDTVYICHKVFENAGNVIRRHITQVGLYLSVLCLVIVLFTYVVFAQLRTVPGKNIMNLTIALLIFDCLWLASSQAVTFRSLCIATASATQYFMLLGHISMAKISHDTWCMFTDPIAHQRNSTTHQFKTFLVLWLVPLAFVGLCLTLWHFNILHVEYTKFCWISGRHVFIIIYIPVCLTIAYNIICFTRSILAMRKLEKNGRMLRAQKQEKSSVFIYIKISTLLGLGWASTFIAVFFQVFSYVFVVLTVFQGVQIFLAFVCKKNVLTMYRNLCGSTNAPASSRSETVKEGRKGGDPFL